MTVISRVQWGARPTAKADPLDAAQVVGLAFHWPAMTTPMHGVTAVSAGLRSWQAFHLSKGWRDIAYQVAVDQDGNRYTLRGLDGKSAANGDEDVNRRYGAVLLVLAPGEQPTDSMIREVRAVVADHRALFRGSKVLVGHQQIRPEPTSCPGPIVMGLLETGVFEPISPQVVARRRALARMIREAKARIAKWRAEQKSLPK